MLVTDRDLGPRIIWIEKGLSVRFPLSRSDPAELGEPRNIKDE
jgi:hypothetical protein